MSKTQNCGDKDCGHDKDSHYSEYPSSGDPTNPAAHVKQFFNCYVRFCNCKKYVPPKD